MCEPEGAFDSKQVTKHRRENTDGETHSHNSTSSDDSIWGAAKGQKAAVQLSAQHAEAQSPLWKAQSPRVRCGRRSRPEYVPLHIYSAKADQNAAQSTTTPAISATLAQHPDDCSHSLTDPMVLLKVAQHIEPRRTSRNAWNRPAEKPSSYLTNPRGRLQQSLKSKYRPAE